MFLLMLFMFCFFLGSIAMFFYLLKRLDNQTRILADEHAQMRVLLRAMESRLEKISQMERLNALMRGDLDPNTVLPGESGDADETAGHDPLLHLSFEKFQSPEGQVNPGLSLDIEPKNWDMGNGRNPQKDQD